MHARLASLIVCSLASAVAVAACGSHPAGDRTTVGNRTGAGAAATDDAAARCGLAPAGGVRHALGARNGSIRGIVCEASLDEPFIGATVVATSPVLVGEQVAITDENGVFEITGLPPGSYRLTFYGNDQAVERAGPVTVLAAKTTPITQRIDTSQSRGELIMISSGPSQTLSATRPVPRTSPPPPAPSPEAQPVEAYDRIDDNPFVRVDSRPLSTFSIDVDTAAYANTRRFLREGTVPPRDAVRIEELVNYFRYAYPLPRGAAPFAVATEVGPSPWNPAFKLVRIGLQTRPLDSARAPARNLVFLIDVSGSMDDPHKLPLLKLAMNLVVDQLRPQDRIAIVVYAGASGVALPPTRGSDKRAIRDALAALEPGGSTNGGAGIRHAYKLARDGFLRGGINRVILCTDGDFNVGVTSEGDLTRLIEQEREHGVFLTVLGFGTGNLKDATMEKLADRGNGNYGYIDSIDEARKLLVKEAGATLNTVAKDVKLQVELNPAMVAGYRLIGYVDRLLHDEDFADDTKDAGELGAGHSVTALYEVVPAGVAVPAAPLDRKKYQQPTAPTAAAAASRELMTIKIRYKAPDATTSTELSHAVVDRTVALAATSIDFRWAAAVAGYGMLLRDTPERGALSWPMVDTLASGALGADPEGYRKELLALVAAAAKLKP